MEKKKSNYLTIFKRQIQTISKSPIRTIYFSFLVFFLSKDYIFQTFFTEVGLAHLRDSFILVMGHCISLCDMGIIDSPL